MKNVLHLYYSGILKKLNTEVNILNELIPHALTKGLNNEESIKSVIKSLLPTKYSVGSGMVIDSFGNRSRQCDIIIFDSSTYSNLFNQTSNSLFPVETVLGCIEIKTFLDDSILDDVIENTRSLKKLKHYSDEIAYNQPDPEYPIRIKKSKTEAPYSYLFAFRTNSNSPVTWKKRFEKRNLKELPDSSILLDNSLYLYFKDIINRDSCGLNTTFYHLREFDVNEKGSETNFVTADKPNYEFWHAGTKYKSSSQKMEDAYPIGMPERAFLTFLIKLLIDIENRPKHITFDPTKYLKETYSSGLEIK
jgi:hypothetical protein